MNKEFEELVKERLRLDPTQAVSKFYNNKVFFMYLQKKIEIYTYI